MDDKKKVKTLPIPQVNYKVINKPSAKQATSQASPVKTKRVYVRKIPVADLKPRKPYKKRAVMVDTVPLDTAILLSPKKPLKKRKLKIVELLTQAPLVKPKIKIPKKRKFRIVDSYKNEMSYINELESGLLNSYSIMSDEMMPFSNPIRPYEVYWKGPIKIAYLKQKYLELYGNSLTKPLTENSFLKLFENSKVNATVSMSQAFNETFNKIIQMI